MSLPPRLPRVSREDARRALRDAADLRKAIGLTSDIEPYLAAMMERHGEGLAAIPVSIFAPNGEALVKARVLEPLDFGAGYFNTTRMRSVARSYRATMALGREGGRDAT